MPALRANTDAAGANSEGCTSQSFVGPGVSKRPEDAILGCYQRPLVADRNEATVSKGDAV